MPVTILQPRGTASPGPDGRIAVSGTAAAHATITVQIDKGGPPHTTTADATGNWSLAVPVSTGSRLIQAADGDGNTDSTRVAVAAAGTADPQPGSPGGEPVPAPAV